VSAGCRQVSEGTREELMLSILPNLLVKASLQ
jgi:hypothetical protein